MSVRTWLSTLASRFTRQPTRRERRAAGLRGRSHRLSVESLEDRSLLAFDLAAGYAVGSNPQALASGDFNGDGHTDLVAANYGDSTVSILLGNADGTFQSAGTFATGADPRSIAVGDFNGDNKLDVATANYGGADVSVLLGNGNGTLGAPLSVQLPAPPWSDMIARSLAVAVGDLNADGKLDLVVASQDELNAGGGYCGYYGCGGIYLQGYVRVFLGNGDGTFAAPTTNELSSGSPIDVAVADVNADGKLDVVTANSDGGTVSVLLGNGDGTLQYQLYWSDYAAHWSAQAVTIGDFTGDGILDVATAGMSVEILAGLGNGTFQTVFREPPGERNVGSVALAAADFNGDGKLDVVTTQHWTGVLKVLLGLGDGTLTPPIDLAAGLQPMAVAVGDFNGDGQPDVAIANAGSHDVWVLLNDGDWDVLPPPPPPPPPPAPSLTISDVSRSEGQSGATLFTFIVTLSEPYDAPVTVDWATADGTATAGSDYEAASGTLTIPAGQTTGTITVLVIGDRLAEPNETFFVNLSSPTNALITDGLGVGTILDDEPYVSMEYFSDVVVTEGNTGTKAMTFTVVLSAASDVPVTVDYSTFDGSAVAGSDYQAASGTLTFAPGETVQTLTVQVIGDTQQEDDEYFFVSLANATHATIGTATKAGYIVNDDTPPTISIGDASVLEGNSGTTLMTFTVSLSSISGQGVWVNYATANGTAKTSDKDYVATSGSIYFAPGETSKTITVSIVGDTKKEKDERFYVELSGAEGATIADNQGVGTILNDDGSGGKGNSGEGNSGKLAAALDAESTLTKARKRR